MAKKAAEARVRTGRVLFYRTPLGNYVMKARGRGSDIAFLTEAEIRRIWGRRVLCAKGETVAVTLTLEVVGKKK